MRRRGSARSALWPWRIATEHDPAAARSAVNTFLLIAALMAAVAAAVVAVPLLRDGRSRLVGAAAGLLVAATAAGLYPLWSNWNWHTSAPSHPAPEVPAMVAKLETHMRSNPADFGGWLMLGRSYLALERVDDAIHAYDHARRLDSGSTDAALGLGEAMILRAGNITPAAAELIEQALKLAPDNPKALLYGGFAALARGDKAAARARWQSLKDLHPPVQIEQMLDTRIAELGAVGIARARHASAGAEATVNLMIAPELKARLTRSAPLFVFARAPGGRGPPLAAKRLTSAVIGTQIQLSTMDSMVPGQALLNGQRVTIVARVSFSGKVLPAAGDLYGELTYDVGHGGPRDLVIDRVAE